MARLVLTLGSIMGVALQALCPDTTRLIHGVLAPLFSNGIAGLMKLRYVAYGKATESPSGLQVTIELPVWCGLTVGP
jgi:hypothetical protein